MSKSEPTPEERQRRREAYPIRFMMSAPDAMYDIGVGPKTEWDVYRTHFPKLETFGVEANPLMVKRILDSGWKGPLVNAAVTSSNEKLDLKVYREDGLDASILEIPGRSVSTTVEVNPISLDELDARFGFKNNILLWIDIEGAELDALKSGEELMRSGRVRWINLEVRPEAPWLGGCTDAEVDTFLTYLGYRKVIEYNTHKNSNHYDVVYFHADEPENTNPKPHHIPQ